MFCIMIYTYEDCCILHNVGRVQRCSCFVRKLLLIVQSKHRFFVFDLYLCEKNNTKFSPTMHEKKKHSPRLSTDKWAYYYCDFMLICYRSHYILIPHMAIYMSEWDLNYVNPFQLYDSTGLHRVYSIHIRYNQRKSTIEVHMYACAVVCAFWCCLLLL